ncbi:Trehalose-6-P synthase/phosphatase complex synthase subunit [Salvia divinorum]|uniref:Trehalose-6-P synthase/phosphatase complex synthase subunit n=1 Tax=Salvia divinorum TaxID=28513 RepID=A0ABD1HH19_SALDI
MEIYSPPIPAIKNGKSLDEIRKSAKFHPSVWGDFFLKYDSDKTKITNAEPEEPARMKERKNSKDNEDLRTLSLRFRLLRQHGYNVPCDVFRKFTDSEGNYAASLQINVEGLLSLYEAAHLLKHDVEILDRAIEFCSSHLRASLHKVASVSLSKRAGEALEMPNRWSLTRLGARKFISAYQEDESHNATLLNFAKLDFNHLQKMHQRELSDATRWWKKLDNNIAEMHFYGFHRDDTYEYATLDELRILTDAIERWDVNETLEDSPPYVQTLYKNLIDTYTEIEDEMGESYCVQYAIQEMKKLLQSYFDEVKWLYNDNYIPTLEEYLKVSVISTGYMMMSTTSLVGMGDDQVSKKDFDWIVNEPLIDQASALLARLLDDFVGDEYEEKPSSIHCYMRQYGLSEDDARGQIKQRVKNAWKDMNQECLESTPASMPILMRVINLARAAQLIYSDGDCYTDPNKSKEWVKMLLIEAVEI